MSKQRRRIAALFALLTAGSSAACEDVEWPEPEYVQTLRVLGVRAEPPTLTPGASTELSVICADGRAPSGEDPECEVEVAWFSGCNNPKGNDPTNCFGRFTPWAEQLEAPIAKTASTDFPAGFGFGTAFSFAAPEAILTQHVELDGSPLRYGTSYVFFAVCAGELFPVFDARERLPVECRDRDSGARLGQDHFVAGVTTLYSYDDVLSRNPVLSSPRFDGVAIPTSCSAASPCPERFDCSSRGQCLPVVSPCKAEDSDDCPAFSLDFAVDPDSFNLFRSDGTRLAAPLKVLWLSALTNAGHLPDETSLRLRSADDPQQSERTPRLLWQAPHAPTEHAHLWAVVRDNRGGLSVFDQRIVVR